jgi:hypothetical protein
VQVEPPLDLCPVEPIVRVAAEDPQGFLGPECMPGTETWLGIDDHALETSDDGRHLLRIG